MTAPHNRDLTRQVRNELAARTTAPPPLFIQSCRDDAGVHEEQVLPLRRAWEAAGGVVHLDERPTGGHTSDHAPRALLVDVVDRLLDGRPVDAARYASDPAFAGSATPVPWSHRIRSRLRLRARLRALAGG